MKNIFNIFITATFFIFILYNAGSAGGIGVYYICGTGINNININLQNAFSKNGFLFQKTDNVRSFMSYGFGFIADSNLDGEKVFNYRFKLGYDYQVSDSDENKKLHRGMMSNIFGASIYKDDILKLWLGPQIGVGYLWGSNTYHDANFLYEGYLLSQKSKSNYSMLDINIGMALGININVVTSVSFAVEGGFRYNFYYNFDKKYINLKKRIEDDFPMMGPEGYISIAIMNRFAIMEKHEADIHKKKNNVRQQEQIHDMNQENSNNERFVPLNEPPEK